jgi:Fe-S cluster biosynthesis and repair protein YggX
LKSLKQWSKKDKMLVNEKLRKAAQDSKRQFLEMEKSSNKKKKCG